MAEDKKNLEQQKTKVEQLIFSDDLTGAYNRRYLYQYLPQEIGRCKLSRQSLWLLMIDIDDFKGINDTYGHLRGDEVLRGVAEILKESVRSADTAIRYAGDEFTVIISSADLNTANAVAKRIMNKAASRIFKGDGKGDFKVNLSIGVASFPDDAGDALTLINMADKALYASKQKGKDCISFVNELTPEMFISRAILEIFPCKKLIERERQIQELYGILDKVREEGKALTVLVKGNAGTGKSRLAEEFAKAVKEQGFSIIIDRCAEKCALSTFRSASLWFDKYLGKIPTKKGTLLSGFSEAEIAVARKIIPSVNAILGEAAGQLEIKEGLDDLILSALRKLVLNLAKENKLCIIIDDLQWVDLGSFNLLATLKEKEADILICGLLREEELNRPASDMPITQLKEQLDGFFSAKVLVDNLSLAGVTEMVKAIFPGLELKEGYVNQIYKVTRGNPLFAEELLKFMVQRGFLFNRKGSWSALDIQDADLPHSLNDLILERIKGLEKPAQEIIAKAAAIGQDFSTEMVRRLGKEDEGYVLDILESAKKVGLIKENLDPGTEVPTGDNMSFANEEIRKTIAGLVGQEELKTIHQQIGEIEENLHADNLGDVAAELFYHFRKSQDFEKAKRYADLIQSARTRQQEALDYAKRFLEEEEESKVLPLSKKSQKLVPDIVRLVYIININSSLYPRGSEMITVPLEELYRKLSELFARDEALVLRDYKDTLVVNGEKLKEPDLKSGFVSSLLNLFRGNNLESIAFKRGLSKGELVTFMENFGLTKEDRKLSEFLEGKMVYKIKAKEVDFSARGAAGVPGAGLLGEAVLMDQLLGRGKFSGKEQQILLEKLKSRPQEVTQMINQFADTMVRNNAGADVDSEKLRTEAITGSIQKIGEQIYGSDILEVDNYKKGLAEAIMHLEPKSRKEILTSERFNIPQNDIIKEVAPNFSDDIIADVFVDEFTQRRAGSSRLKSMVNRFLADPDQKKRLQPVLRENLEKLGLAKEESSWVFGEKKWRDCGLEDRLNRFLQMTAGDYLNLEEEVDVKSLASEIIKTGKPDFLVKFLNKWEEFFRNDDPAIRKLLAASFSGVMEALPLSGPELLKEIVDFLFTQARRETHPEIYQMFVGQLISPVEYLLSTRHFLGIRSVMERLDAERARFASGLEAKAVQEVYDRILTANNISAMIDELLSRIDKNLSYPELTDIIALSGEVMIKPLVDQAMVEDKELAHLGYFGVYLRRRAVGEALAAIAKRTGFEAIAGCINEKLLSVNPEAVRNAMDLVVYIQNPNLCRLLTALVRHPDVAVRKKLTVVLSKFPTEENISLLGQLLQDDDKEVRSNAINLLGKIGDRTALALLKDLKDAENEQGIQSAIEMLEKRLSK
ncbi:MAG: diguanylate cyclase [Candidatus Omnitrophota bacterium]